ncbi:MAG TPA: ABC transporter permease [Thermoanaerobaculia bacterium]|nr:ABC transporter permease [Thermoanaerobaculia bacterium]
MGLLLDLVHDARHGARALRRDPWFTIAAVASLAVGIGAVTAIFTLVSSLLLRPLPGIAEPDRLVNVFRREVGDPESLGGFPLPVYQELRSASGSFAGLAAYTDRPMSLTRGGESELVAGQIVSGNYFSTLGVRPVRGRFFLPEEERVPGGHPVAVVSHALWLRGFGGDPALVGREVVLNGLPFTVVGIAPPGFGGTFFGFVYDVWVPTAMAEAVLRRRDLRARDTAWLEVVGRLAPGVSLPRAQAVAATVARRQAQDFPTERDFEIAVTPLTGYDEELRGGVVAFLAVLLAVSLFILLIACFNVAGMLLARSVARGQEIAIRLALGMSRRRLVRQLLTEGLLLALLGGAAGALLAAWGVALLRRLEVPRPLVLDFALDLPVLAFTLAVSALSGLAFALLPLRQARRPDLVAELKESAGAGGGGRLRLRSALVVAQVAVCLLLLATGGLFLHALRRVAAASPGFEPAGVTLLTLDPSILGYEGERLQALFLALRDRAAALPGVEAASLADSTPLSLARLFGGGRTEIAVEGREPPPGRQALRVHYSRIASRYFATLRIPLLAGRDFTEADRADAPAVAVVNRTLARRFWPGEEAIGQRLVHAGRRVEVVGVVADSTSSRVSEAPRAFLYLPFLQVPSARMTLLVRAAGAPTALGPALRGEVQRLDPSLPILGLASMEESIATSRLPQRVAAMVAGAIGLVGLLLAAVGIYGVVSYSVVQRRREIGVRMALGAERRSVLWLVTRQGLVLALAGVAIGAAGAFALGRLLAGLLLGTAANDPLVFGAVAALLVGTAAAASLLPARRAARLDPARVLRSG